MDTRHSPSLFDTLTQLGLDERGIRQYLTPMTSAICDLVGLRTTLAIIEHLGGRQIALTNRPTDKAPLVRVAGEKNARRITEFFGSDQHITIPNPFSNRVLLRLEGAKMLRAGRSYSDVAQALRVSRSTVCSWGQAEAIERRPPARPSPAAAAPAKKTAAPVKPGEKRETRKRAFGMFRAGKRIADICAALGEDETTVRKWQRQYGAES